MITAVTREAWGTHIGETGPHQTFRDRIMLIVGSTVARPLPDDAPDEELSDRASDPGSGGSTDIRHDGTLLGLVRAD